MRSGLFSSFLLLTLLWPAAGAGLTPRLVKDINPIPKPESSSPANFLTIGGVTFFVANDGDTGREMWRSDGTVAGTYQLTDACAGECSSNPMYLTHTDKAVFFLAGLPGGGLSQDLWVSGGTPATTFRLTGALVFSLPVSSRSCWIPEQKVLYFAAADGVHGAELWRSDGTPAGTYLLSDLRSGSSGSEPKELTDFKGQLFFSADDGQRGPVLWKSDGTPQGTQAVRDPLPSSASHKGPSGLRVAGGALFFVAPAPGLGTELWKSDGTTRGTAPLTDLVRGTGSPLWYDISVAANRLYFVTEAGNQGQELWTTDGTPRGTKALTSFSLAPAFFSFSYSLPLPRTPLGSRIVFAANDGPHGIELWVSDGTTTGTRLLRDVCPGACWGTFSAGVVSGNRLFFPGQNAVRGQELWTTDGAPEGTRIVRDICRGSCSSYPDAPFAVGGKLFFVAQNGADGDHNYWRTDGTTAGTVQLTDFTGSIGIGAFEGAIPGAALGNNLLFAARDSEHGSELWQSNGTAAGTQPLVDINDRDLGGSDPISFRALGSNVLFFADDGVHGVELWKSDGTADGTSLVHEFIPGPEPRFGRGFSNASDQAAGKLFFFSPLGSRDYTLWRTDGTDAGTLRLIPEDVQPFSEMRAMGGTLFFGASDEEHGSELWKSDGTPAGTVLVKDIKPGDSGSAPLGYVAFQGRLYFTASGPEQRGLWASDGTAAGTVLVKNVNPLFGSEPEALTEHAGRLWFLADGLHGRELWSTDGTSAGTVLVVEFPPGPDSWPLNSLTSAGARLFVYGNNATFDGFRLWITDGTVAGTRRILSLPGFTEDRPVALGGKLFFGGSYGSFSSVLWKSDGTDTGTVPVLDRNGQPVVSPAALQPFEDRVVLETVSGELWQADGTAEGTFKIREVGEGGLPELVPAGHRLFFRGYDRETGTELWALEPQ